MTSWLTKSFSATAMVQKSDNFKWALFLSFATFPTVCSILKNSWQNGGKRGYLVNRELLDRTSIESAVNKVVSSSMTPTERVNYWINKDPDNYFLQEVLGERALTWVKQRNEYALGHLGDPTDTPLYKRILDILDSKEKIPYFTKHLDHIYNFWQDDEHPRGILRRTTLQDYQSTLSPLWETVLDIDALGKIENESWVYKGYVALEQDGTSGAPAPSRILLYLSRGGSDATIIREFDLSSNTFVVDRPFHIPIEAKTRVAWKDIDTLWIGTNLDATDASASIKSMTSSGYPRVVREWKRGDKLTAKDTQVLFEGEESDVSVSGNVYKHGEYTYAFYRRSLTFYTERTSFQLLAIPPHSPLKSFLNQWFTLPVPEDMDVTVFQDQFLLQLRSDWQLLQDKNVSDKITYTSGSLLAVPIASLLSAIPTAAPTTQGNSPNITWLSNVTVLFAPSKTTSLDSFTKTKEFLIVTVLDTVKTRLSFWKLHSSSESLPCVSSWRCIGEEPQAQIRGVSVSALDLHASNEYLLTTSSFVKPTQLWLANAEEGVAGIAHAQLLRSLTKQFDSYDDSSSANNDDALCEYQYEAVSLDGTKVPYFVIAPKGLQYHGLNPTLLYGYGGFEISLTPSYASVLGATWLNREMMFGKDNNSKHTHIGEKKRSTVYVVANIRGGGEFGPTWHQAALREKRHVAYEDFIAVAEDLIHRRITQREYLAIRGGSNGGLLVGNAMTLRPDLFAAVCCAVPLLDMRVYHTLLAGASWQAEYGNPDVPEDWAFLQRYSAYHQIDPTMLLREGGGSGGGGEQEVQKYPALLMTTSTRDDRVHPYHARCFVKRLIDSVPGQEQTRQEEAERNGQIHKGDVFYYENMEGGHGGAADNKQQAFMNALYLEFLRRVIIITDKKE